MKAPFHALVFAAYAAIGCTAAAALDEASSAAAGPEAEAAGETPAWLNQRETRQLREGRGMGMGRVAAVNGYPGPMHVLRQAEELELSDEQREQTTALRERVHARSRELGERIIAAESRLGDVLAADAVDRDALRAALGEIADLRADLRAAHIEAHLDQADILTPEQRSRLADMGQAMQHGRQHGQRERHRHRRGMRGGEEAAGEDDGEG